MKTKIYTLILLVLFTSIAYTQTASNNSNIQFIETFGAGSQKTALPEGRTTYNYNALTSLEDGDYFLYKKTNGRPEWHNSNDHTGDANGRAMVINAGFTPGEFYRDTVSSLTANSFYSVYMYVMNLNTVGTCGTAAILPKLQIAIEVYSSVNRTFIPLTSFTSGYIQQTANPTWVVVGGSFTLPKDITAVRYRIINNSTGGCGNDLAIDDITFVKGIATLLPVTGLKATAFRTGNDVTLNWQTLSETNTSYFVAQKSTNGKDWQALGTVKAAGNSQSKIEYSIKDENPGAENQYRIEQVDFDGNFSYSNVVLLKINDISTKVNIYPNPFAENVQVDMHTDRNQPVTIRVVDQSGRSIKQLAWDLKKGDNSIVFSDLRNMPTGMYLLDIRSADGQAVYSGKLIKR